MSMFLTLAFLFAMGSMAGWVLEVFFRRFFSTANPERKWINPGFCTGPCLPIYGSGLCILYLISIVGGLENVRAVLFTMPGSNTTMTVELPEIHNYTEK